ncbi:MAG: ABC transporter ATP-binding protein [Desulfobacterales bacterium]|jgi:tungstate transport system ATP-binding protein
MLYILSHLTKVYKNRTVLDIPTLEIQKGGVYALLGPNGAGKTTLLNILGFLESPTSGYLEYCSRPVRFIESDLQPLRKEVVVVDQHPILFTTTVYKNLEFGLKIRGTEKTKRRRIIEETLELVDMRNFAQAPAHLLSGGETQRVALARALAVSPKVFLCDEPTASVDIENQHAIIRILKQINDIKQITVLFTTHDRSQAAGLAKHTLVLHHGRLVPTLYENIFSGDLIAGRRDQYQCIINKKIRLSIKKDRVADRHGKVRVFIDPDKIDFVRLDEGDHNAMALPGKVVQVTQENGRIRVVVDTGVWITLYMSHDHYKKSPPSIGEQVTILPTPESVHLL